MAKFIVVYMVSKKNEHGVSVFSRCTILEAENKEQAKKIVTETPLEAGTTFKWISETRDNNSIVETENKMYVKINKGHGKEVHIANADEHYISSSPVCGSGT